MGLFDFIGKFLGTSAPETASTKAASNAPASPYANQNYYIKKAVYLKYYLGQNENQLKEFRPEYNTFQIPKRSGGARTINEPKPETKALQHKILRMLRNGNTHKCAVGFRRGRGIVHNAIPHVGKAVVLKMDIRNFFPSVTREKCVTAIMQTGWEKGAAEILADICCLNGGLPQGAPTSPLLSNIANTRLDCRLYGLAKKLSTGTQKVDYTRYADDITFSFATDEPGLVRGVITLIFQILHEEGYQVNKKKTRVMRQHQRQTVTGLVVNETINIPRKQRRKIRAAMHRISVGEEPTLTNEQLQGWMGMLSLVQKGKEEYL
ncbi:MAG: RNA-directed DNA polymerase [Planctomycetes bacterium]|nr:RNA-directed DNA polymerase [Planctomycetota bacterium]